MSDVDVVIIGAGAAGLGAAKQAARRGLSLVVVEGGHRIGGRAYTETFAPGVPFDLGCHWLHSASINPFTRIADDLGFAYDRTESWARRLHWNGRWATHAEHSARLRFLEECFDAVHAAGHAGRDVAMADVTVRDSPYTPFFDYIASMMWSTDADQVSVLDSANYHDTDENWPVAAGYGALVARWGADVPVTLNAPVERLEWGGPAVTAVTPKGAVRARAAIVTVSTGVLANGAIRFDPALPEGKRAAWEALPLGVHNRIGLAIDGDPFGPDAPRALIHADADHEPMHIRIRPFGLPYVVGVTGGRFGAWLERAGADAAVDHLKGRLERVFGAAMTRRAGRAIVTAWGGDALTFGSYSAAMPGTGWRRAALAQPVEDRVFFAGEATSTEFFATCHGAMLSGARAADEVAVALGTSAVRRREA
ncbi:MAG: flavin monoamine oxidase family protein [Alphaproteobacteria bacterium]